MSAGVPEQRIKGQGNQASKNVEERSIPWSQQVDEAFFEVLPSPSETIFQGPTGSGTQFQYPPFNVRGGNSSLKNNQDENKRNKSQSDGFNQSYNYYLKKYEYENIGNSKTDMNANLTKKASYDDNSKSKKNNYLSNNNETVKGLQNLSIEYNERSNKGCLEMDQLYNGINKKNINTSITEQSNAVVKQMTWASIASQPAKPTLRSNLISSTLKKKGPGMPPPPMVPGKHNMDINTWDNPKNSPTLVPPPPLPVIPVPIVGPVFEQGKTVLPETNSCSRSNNEIGLQKEKSDTQKSFERCNHLQGSRGKSNDIKTRPPWVPQYQQQNDSFYTTQNKNNINQSNYRNINSINHNKIKEIKIKEISVPPNYYRQNPESSLGNNSLENLQNAISPTPSTESSTAQDFQKEQKQKNHYNPRELDIQKASSARFFVIKSYSEDDIYRSIKYGIWCSTDHGNRRLDDAFHERQKKHGLIYLLFSVNGSKHFCGIAQMMSAVDYNSVSNVWSQKKWKGTFKVKWLYVKDVPNPLFKHITIETNENKPVTHSRDTQEVPNDKGILVMQIIHEHEHITSLVEDFSHYEKRQEEEKVIKRQGTPKTVVTIGNRSHRSSAVDYLRGSSYDNNKSSFRDRKSFNRDFHNNFNRRGNDCPRNIQDIISTSTIQNSNRENNLEENYYSGATSVFRTNNNRRDDRVDESNLSAMENRIFSGNHANRSDNRLYTGSFRDKEKDNYKKKGGWRTAQRSIDLTEKEGI